MSSRLHQAVVCLAIVQVFSASAEPATSPGGMQITRAGSQPSSAGPDAFFTGRARVDPIWPADANINAAGANVTFEAGARSAWHTHPAGQHLVVVSGVGGRRSGESRFRRFDRATSCGVRRESSTGTAPRLRQP